MTKDDLKVLFFIRKPKNADILCTIEFKNMNHKISFNADEMLFCEFIEESLNKRKKLKKEEVIIARPVVTQKLLDVLSDYLRIVTICLDAIN